MTPAIRPFERLTAADMFMLWDDYGWSSDIGALAVLDGTNLLDDEGTSRSRRSAVSSS